METFLEYESMCREPPPGHMFLGRLTEIDPRKVAEVVRRLRHKKNKASATHFFCSVSETYSAISLETCKA